MPLIVDCYNVLHVAMPPMLAGLNEAGLCRALGRTAWGKAGVTIVADGRVKPLGVAESPVAGIDLVYAGSHRSADDLIIQLINRDSAPRRLTVVSSDRVIRAAARRRGARDLASEDFVDRMCHQLRQHRLGPPPPSRPAIDPLPPELVQRWREVFGV